MPGHYIHIAASDAVRQDLEKRDAWKFTDEPDPDLEPSHWKPQGGPPPRDLAQIANAHPSYYAFGAVGPDLFLLLPDFRAGMAQPLIAVLEFVDDLYEKFDDWFLKYWERYAGPVGENVTELMSRLTGDLTTVVSDIVGQLATVFTDAILDLATQAHDTWGEFSLGLNRGVDNQDYFWSDMLHYRRTSAFARGLWLKAADRASDVEDPNDEAAVAEAKLWSDRLSAYALGYMTHLSTDLTGHPFVNEKSGGPYRTEWQRHHLVENHMDASAYQVDHGSESFYEQLTKSALYFRIAFRENRGFDDWAHDPSGAPLPDFGRPTYSNANTLRALYERRRHLNQDSALPEEIAQLLVDVMETTYGTDAPPNPARTYPCDSVPQILPGDGRPDVELIGHTYLVLYRYMKQVMVDGFNTEKPNPPELFPNLDFPQLTDPADDPPGEGAEDKRTVWDTILAIIRFILWIVAIAIWLATVLPGIFADIGTYEARVLAYYTIELPLWYLIRAERSIMVETGYILPNSDEIDLGLVRLCTGHRGALDSVFAAMDDALGMTDDQALATLQDKASELAKTTGIPLDQALAAVLADISLLRDARDEPLPDPVYPHSHELDPSGNPIAYHHPWIYPTTPGEAAATVAGPWDCGDVAHVLLEGGVPGSQALRELYEQATRPRKVLPNDPDGTDDLSERYMSRQRNMGDPVNFGSYLVYQLTRAEVDIDQLTNWNLDSDRGYAYKCWDWDRHADPGRLVHGTANHVFFDVDNHEFLEPCTHPPQWPVVAERDPRQALKIHYCDQDDPHCADDRPVG
jgi:hypothetical protein